MCFPPQLYDGILFNLACRPQAHAADRIPPSCITPRTPPATPCTMTSIDDACPRPAEGH